MKNSYSILTIILTLILASLACGTLNVGVESNSTEDQASNLVNFQETNTETADTTDQANISTTQDSEEQEHPIPAIAYIGQDHNMWFLEEGSQTPRQLTFDAKLGGDGATVEYLSPSLSSDGALLAYKLQIGTPNANGHEYIFEVWVMNLATGEQSRILDRRSGGMAWKPGTHTLAYGIGLELEYFVSLSNPPSRLSTGIYTTDLDSGETLELVAPERGYALSGPDWSLDGRFLSFSEVNNMEGSGLFAYYDIEGEEYVAWDEAVGNTSWSPDGSLLAYARIVYVPTGDERLYLRPRQGREQLIGPEFGGPAFAHQPVFSPAGDQIAYLYQEEAMSDFATIMVLDLDNEQSKSLGQFEDVWEFAWTPDGSQLVFSFGIYPDRQITAINVEDGSQTILAAGDHLSLAGQ